MSRHRDVRNMDYSDDYDGYDDIYGHSVDDDYYISPSNTQFLYNRENSGQSRSGDSYPMEQDIQEEDEIEEENKLTDTDRAKLESCLEHVKTILAPINMLRQELVRIIIDNKFDREKIINVILNTQSTRQIDRREKGDATFDQSKTRNNLKSNTHNTYSRSPNKVPNSTLQAAISDSTTFSAVKPKMSFCPLSARSTTQSAANYHSNSLNENARKSSDDIGRDCVDGISAQNTINVGPSASFISKIRNNDPSSNKVSESGPISLSFPLKKKPSIHGRENYNDELVMANVYPQRKTTPRENFRALSFISKINKPPDILDSEGNSSNSSTNISPSYEIMSLKKQPDVSNVLENISKHFSKSIDLENENEGQNKIKKANTFLRRIATKESGVIPQCKSEVQCNFKELDITQNLSRLKLTEVKSLPTFQENIQKNNFNIDLTVALRKSKDDIIQPKSVSSKDEFEMPFVSCEEPQFINGKKKKKLKCTIDLSRIALLKIPIFKRKPSSFAKIMCLNFSIPKAKLNRKKIFQTDPRITRFNFSVPSPDDKIIKYLPQDV